jgi:hypothetical protein
MDAPFGSIFDEFDKPRSRRTPPPTGPSKTEKGIPWAAKRIDGKLYVPLEQVHELLKINDILPAVRRGLEKHL